MSPFRRHTCAAIGAALAAGALPRAVAQGTEWPSRPLRIVVGFSSGVASDMISRVYAAELSKVLAQPVTVENRPGAGGTLAAEHVARAPADGYTIYYGSTGPLAIAPHLYKTLGFDPLRDFEAVATAGLVPMVLVTGASSPFTTIGELVRAGKAENGATINYGSIGNGGLAHLSMELFKTATGTKFTHVPYKGSAQLLTDLAGGSVQVAFDTGTAVRPFVRSGRVRVLGVGTTARLPDMPEAPTLAEAVPGFSSTAWGMYLVPRATPEPVVARLRDEFERLHAVPVIRDKMLELGVARFDHPPAALRKFLEQELEVWGKAVGLSGATAG
jgi:tripartite-type tricarboxylate transporter receptor subunit TctC